MSNNQKTVKFGIFGLGRVVEKRVYSVFVSEITNSKVVAVFDKNPKKNVKFSSMFNCETTNTLKNFLSKDIDIVYVATESGNHYNNIINCFKFNKNVIVEKPPVLKINQLIKLNNIAKRKKLKFFSIYQNRENKPIKFLKKNFKKIFNEKIIFVNLKLLWSRNQKYYSDWHGKWKMDGGVLAQQGIHYIDLLCYFFGKPLKCISLIENKSNKLQAEDTHIGIVQFKSTNCTINLTTAIKPSDQEASIEIFSKTKMIKLYGLCCNKIKITPFDGKKRKLFNSISKKYSFEVPNGYGLSYKIVLQNVVNNFLKKNSTKPLDAIKTANTLKLVHMFYKSVEKNKWILNIKNNFNSRLGS